MFRFSHLSDHFKKSEISKNHKEKLRIGNLKPILSFFCIFVMS